MTTLTAALLSLGFLGGCNVCADLDERVCTDLGPEDCEVWKASGQTFEEQAKMRPRKWLQSLLFGPDANGCRASGQDAVYQTMLNGFKQQAQYLKDMNAKKAALEKAP